MADSNIKKITIKKSDLPNPIGDNDILDYNIRYRVISEDKNRFSHWSKITTLSIPNTGAETGFDPNNPTTTSIPHNVIVEKSRHVAEIYWTMPSLLDESPLPADEQLRNDQASIKEFDVYVQWKISSIWSDWIWVGTSNGRFFSLNYSPTTTATHIKFRVQRVTILKEPFNAATYLISQEEDL